MTTVAIEQPQKNLTELLAEVEQGEHVVFTRDDIPVAELVPITRNKQRPGFGSLRGIIKTLDNFDDPLEDIVEYME